MYTLPISVTVLQVTPFLGIGVALVWAIFSDVRYYVIPNAVSIIVTAAYAASAVSMPLASVVGALAIASAVFLLGATLFSFNQMGGGDVKLLTSLALWAGPTLLAPFAIVTCLAALVLSALMLSPLRSIMPPASASATAMTGSNQGARRAMPFGVAIAIGGFFLLARHVADLR